MSSGKRWGGATVRAQQLHPVLMDQLPEGLPSIRPLGNDGLGVGPVADFPTLANALTGR